MRIVILGCGTIGAAAGLLLQARGHDVVGIRRHATPSPLPLLVGDGADPELWQRLPEADAVLLTATPGLRRGGDNRLDRAAQQIPGSPRIVYSGTTAVYGEAAGTTVAEDGPLAAGAEALLAVETAVLAHGDALVLRCPALTGPTRTRIRARAAAAAAADTPLVVPGDPDRPFSYLHDDDLAWLLAEAVDGRLAGLRGILNAAHPQPTTVRAHYSRHAGITITITSDGSVKPARAIDATRLHRLLPEHTWRTD
jgi:nucleoside-diphosphate-sugar epimerase